MYAQSITEHLISEVPKIVGRSWLRFLSGTQIFFFVPCSCHVDQFTFHNIILDVKKYFCHTAHLPSILSCI